MKKTIAIGLVLVGTLAASFSAQAQFQRPEDAVKYRQSALSVMGTHFGRVGAVVQGRVPFDAKAVQDNLSVVEELARLPWAGFSPDTEKVTSRTKPEAYKEQAKFKELADKMQAEVTKLVAAGKTGNLDQIKAAFGPVGASCKACHDAYQVPRQ
jgi:cytochrome c556